MHSLLSEYVLKGIYLGLILYVAAQEPDWTKIGQFFLFVGAGLLLFLGIAAVRKLREGYRVTGRAAAFVLFLLLESPGLVYAGVLLGTALGALQVSGRLFGEPPAEPVSSNLLVLAAFGGAVLGLVFSIVRTLKDKKHRLYASAGLAAALTAAIVYWVTLRPDVIDNDALRTQFGVFILLSIPVFYLLTFAGSAEESEVEIGAMCAALGLGLWMLTLEQVQIRTASLLLPLLLYYFYATRVLPGLRVFKHVVRGIGYANVGRTRAALIAFRRALALDPGNTLARENFWNLHRKLDLNQLAQDKETLALVDFNFCVERVRTLLLEARPSEDRLKEAHHLLDLVTTHRPVLGPAVHYWRAVAHVHSKNFEDAAKHLNALLDTDSNKPGDPYRLAVLMAGWQLALILHPEMNRRVGAPQLARPGRRLEAIASVEATLADNPEDPDAWALKRTLYAELHEKDYVHWLAQIAEREDAETRGRADAEKEATVPASPRPRVPASSLPATEFDHTYVEQLGMALVGDKSRWQRGAEYLRLAARGLPGRAPVIFQHVAAAHEAVGQPDQVRAALEQGRQIARAVGPKNLDEENRKTYFEIVKKLGDQARERNDLDAAIENYQLYTENERAGLETLRILADLYEKRGKPLPALRAVEQALIYNSKDADLLARKDKYYYSVMPDELKANLDSIRNAFDVPYCLKKAKGLLDQKEVDLELLDWAQHLVELARVVEPGNMTARIMLARLFRRRGELEKAQEILEDTRTNKPEKFQSGDDEESWYLGCRLLGEMYLYDLNRADQAVACFNDFKKSARAGADTHYKLGLCYEQLGDKPRAIKCFELVTAYEGHPLAGDAQQAIYRLKG